MKAIVLSIFVTAFLTGCSLFGGRESPKMTPVQSNYYTQPTAQKEEAKPGFWAGLFSSPKPKSVGVQSNPPVTTLSTYVARMARQMLDSARYVNPRTPIGVASFVSLENLRKTNPFGMQIAESFVFEMQQHGLSVIDYKATGFIRITPNGDFVYSRNIKELPKVQPIEYLLIGTYSHTMNGFIINARIVGAKSKVVVASAQQLIPTSVFNSVMDINPNRNKPKMRDGVLLIESPKRR
ncbi:MAG: hypothetical protein CENE_00380 [Candidatus Celerinatantimonas neptuna]|nr:MAG: hypothetical protein CENE_00380 [Candidatus Celerinatantimonas neptuna]